MNQRNCSHGGWCSACYAEYLVWRTYLWGRDWVNGHWKRLLLLWESQKAWSRLSPSRSPVHLGLWGLSFPSVESQSETLFLFLFWFMVLWFLANTNCDLVNIVCVYNFKLGLRWVSGQTQSLSSLGPKVRIQTHGSPKNASWGDDSPIAQVRILIIFPNFPSVC